MHIDRTADMASQSYNKKKKNVKPSAFMTFLMEFKNDEAKKGNFMNMQSAQEAAGILWNVSANVFCNHDTKIFHSRNSMTELRRSIKRKL